MLDSRFSILCVKIEVIGYRQSILDFGPNSIAYCRISIAKFSLPFRAHLESCDLYPLSFIIHKKNQHLSTLVFFDFFNYNLRYSQLIDI